MHQESSLERESRRVADQVAHWTPARWRLPAGDASRGDAIHALIQTLADLDADTEGLPRRQVPRLPHDTALPDQLRVVARDLAAARPDTPAMTAGRAAIAAGRVTLFPSR